MRGNYQGFIKWLKGRSRLAVSAVCLALVLLLGVIGVLSTPPLSYALFHLLVVASAAWAGGRGPGIFIAIASAFTLLADEYLEAPDSEQAWVYYWNLGVRIGAFVFVVMLVTAVRKLTDELEQRVSARTDALEREIKERKHTEEQLRTATSQFRELADNITKVFWIRNAGEDRVLYVSPAYEGIWGRTCESVYQSAGAWMEPIHPDDRPHVRIAALAQHQGREYNVEYRIVRPDGTQRWIRDRAFPVRDSSGQMLRIAGIAEDITEQKAINARLSVQHAVDGILSESAALVEAAPRLLEAICVNLDWDCAGLWTLAQAENAIRHVADWSKPEPALREYISEMRKHTFGANLGITGRAWIEGHAIWLADLGSGPDFARAPLAARAGLRSALIIPLRVNNEVLAIIEVFSREPRQPEAEVLKLCGTLGNQIGQFIARRNAEEFLRAQAEVLANMVEGVAMADLNGTIRFTNPAMDTMFGYQRGELVGTSLLALSAGTPDECASFLPGLLEHLEAKGTWAGECRHRRKDGSVFISEARISTLEISGRLHLVMVQEDITERRRLAREIIEISDREQARIGQDLHDGLCQQLVSAAFDSNSLQQQLARRGLPEAEEAAQLAGVLDDAITAARAVARGLFPVQLVEDGLSVALQELAANVSARFKTDCRLHCTQPVFIEDNAVATHLYRIAQEAVANAVKHGKAGSIVIQLTAAGEEIELSVTDDGAGIASPAQNAAGMGLHIMTYRTRTIGGKLTVSHLPGGGTTISCCTRQQTR